jgi:hypothetical protein
MATCKKFPNTSVTYGARKFRGSYRGYVTCAEWSAWTKPCRYSKRSDVTRLTRADALSDAAQAADAAIATGYVPAF